MSRQLHQISLSNGWLLISIRWSDDRTSMWPHYHLVWWAWRLLNGWRVRYYIQVALIVTNLWLVWCFDNVWPWGIGWLNHSSLYRSIPWSHPYFITRVDKFGRKPGSVMFIVIPPLTVLKPFVNPFRNDHFGHSVFCVWGRLDLIHLPIHNSAGERPDQGKGVIQ